MLVCHFYEYSSVDCENYMESVNVIRSHVDREMLFADAHDGQDSEKFLKNYLAKINK